MRSSVTVKLSLQSTSVWNRGLVELSSVCFQGIIRLKIGRCLWSSMVVKSVKI